MTIRETSLAEFDAMLNYAKYLFDTHKDYDIFGKNCVDFVHAVLTASHNQYGTAQETMKDYFVGNYFLTIFSSYINSLSSSAIISPINNGIF